eukprot:TRINITY_DN41531_c0_g1_i1.p1 TRINITY_DN41531_c0_g1~~TRINITY_DN41531_c0_g1_i1.p1  ORF type:complete len:532 (+),score=75.44 TRINITY_DN41531_c0_g1_i1:58-1653(+)
MAGYASSQLPSGASQVGLAAGLSPEHSHQVLTFLDASSVSKALMTSKTHAFAIAAAGESLWENFAFDNFHLSSEDFAKGPFCENCGLNAKSFGLWLPLREWCCSWHSLREWLRSSFPPAAASLNPRLAKTREEVHSIVQEESKEEALENAFAGVASNPLLLGLWAGGCDGQDTFMEPRLAEMLGLSRPTGQQGWSHGVFGGYTVYDHSVCTALLPFRAALKLTCFLYGKIGNERIGSSKFAFACSYNLSKIFLVDVRDGCVYVWGPQSSQGTSELAMTPKVSIQGLSAKPELNGRQCKLIAFDESKGRWQVEIDGQRDPILVKPENLHGLGSDCLLRWFREYVQRVQNNMYQVMELNSTEGSATLGIRLFPCFEPQLSRCVTRGVECTGSPIYMAEHPQGWTYSISFRLVGTSAERGYQTCQLHQRIWKIAEDGREPQEIKGDGVIGLFPILTDEGWILNTESDPHGQYSGPRGLRQGAFCYQSCSGRSLSMKGSFEGELQFFPGTKREPTGAPFMVRLAPFRLEVPDYIF